jgi:riboflavin kinase/FMN adenylyltransferase
MKVYTNLDEIQQLRHAVVTIGTFDGVHLGHGKILQHLVSRARLANGESVVFTFFPHPRMVLFPHDTNLKLLTGQHEKIRLIESYGIDHLVIYPFSRGFSRLSAEDFVRELLVGKLHMKELVIGYDHHFGRNRQGSIKDLVEMGPVYDFKVEEIPARLIDEIAVSSTKIRNALNQGDVETAQKLLGYSYELTGMVEHGNKTGRSLGYPTANLNLPEPFKLIPAHGVYITKCNSMGHAYKGIMNIGTRPTVDNENRLHVEVHLLDANPDLYGELVQVIFLKRLRNEIKFENINALVQQIKNDEQAARAYFNLVSNVN